MSGEHQLGRRHQQDGLRTVRHQGGEVSVQGSHSWMLNSVSPTKLVNMKLEHGQHGCFVAALCLLKCTDDDNEWKMRMSPSWLLRLYPQLDYYELWQQQYAVWMHWCCHWIWQVCPCANNAWGWQPQYILLRGDIVVVHSVHFTRTKYYVLQIFAVQSN